MIGLHLSLISFTLLSGLSAVNAHGLTTSPPSRQQHCVDCYALGSRPPCSDEFWQYCDGVQWNPTSVWGPQDAVGRDALGLCNGGGNTFDSLNVQRPDLWPATKIKANEDLNVTWEMSAYHDSALYAYWITHDEWNSTQTTRVLAKDLDSMGTKDKDAPVPSPPAPVTHTLSKEYFEGREGYHVIVAEWRIKFNTAESFYSCIDIDIKDKDDDEDDDEDEDESERGCEGHNGGRGTLSRIFRHQPKWFHGSL